MARKKQVKAKEPVRIRFKELANGSKSIYLDIYVGGKRRYEFLKLYIVPEVDTAAKVANANALQAARAIQAQRIIDIANNKAGISKDYGNMLLTDWLRQYQELRLKTGQSAKRAEQIGTAIKHLEQYNAGRKIRMRDVDENYCKGYIAYLNTAKSRTATVKEKALSKSSAKSYFVVLCSALKEALRQRIIAVNPAANLSREDRKPINADAPEVGYLTIEELQAMINCTYERQNKLLRKAFLFACYTGLRISDIRSLRWNEIRRVGDRFYIHKLMQKTMTYIDLPLPEQAVYWLPNKGDSADNGLVFPTADKWSRDKLVDRLPVTQWCRNTEIRRWANMAGVKKHITFHMSRHTYATTLITLGADVFTVQKLLGHKSIQTTQVYAELVGKKKREAVNLLDKVIAGDYGTYE